MICASSLTLLDWVQTADVAVPLVRLKCVEYATQWITFDAAILLDREVYVLCDGDKRSYTRAMRGLLYNIETNTHIRECAPHKLTRMSDAEMCEGTVVHKVDLDQQERMSHFEAMLQARAKSVESTRSIMTCRKCKRSNGLVFEQKQVRNRPINLANILQYQASSARDTCLSCSFSSPHLFLTFSSPSPHLLLTFSSPFPHLLSPPLSPRRRAVPTKAQPCSLAARTVASIGSCKAATCVGELALPPLSPWRCRR